MSLALKIYKDFFIKRFDKDGYVPYLSYIDFNGLKCEKNTFKNSKGVDIAYFYYNYDQYDENKIILFLHGIGPGHTAYMSEINTLCSLGYRVLTLDYTGCDSSGGDKMYSVNAPTRDVNDLLNYLKLDKEVVLVGHSLGAYTSIQTLYLRKDIRKGVIISGFYSIEKEMLAFMKLHIFTNQIMRFEKEVEPEYFNLDNLHFLENTNKRILFIHSKDDNIVPYKTSCKEVEKLANPNLSFIIVDKKRHNPNYTEDAVKYMNDTFSAYNSMLKNRLFKTDEERRKWMNEKSLARMTAQDMEIINKIIDFIK